MLLAILLTLLILTLILLIIVHKLVKDSKFDIEIRSGLSQNEKNLDSTIK